MINLTLVIATLILLLIIALIVIAKYADIIDTALASGAKYESYIFKLTGELVQSKKDIELLNEEVDQLIEAGNKVSIENTELKAALGFEGPELSAQPDYYGE